MAKNIVMTGATGFIGRRVCAALLERGDRVTALSRNPGRAQQTLPGVDRCVLWSPGVAGAWCDCLDGADAVLHLAGESVAGRRWSAAFKQQVRESRVRGTRDIVEAIVRADTPPPVLISASGIGYYGDSGEETVTEHAQPGHDFLAEVCQAWEAEASRAAADGVRVVLLRTGLVLSRDGGALPRLARPFSLYVGGPIGSGRQWFPWIHIDDAVAAILHCLDSPRLQGPVNLVAPDMTRNRAFCAALGGALRRPSWLRVPGFALRAGIGPFAETLLGGQRAIPEQLQASGFAFRHPLLDEALASIYPHP